MVTFNKLQKLDKKREARAFKEEFKDITEDEHTMMTRLKAIEMLRYGRKVTFEQAREVLYQFRALKAQAAEEGVTVDILAARTNHARRLMAKEAQAQKKESITA